MHLHDWWQLLIQQTKETTLLEWVTVALCVAEVLFALVNNIWLYPTGIAGTLLSVYVLFVAGLYAECLLDGYYVVMSVYGWWYWVKKKNLPPVKITYSNQQEWTTTVLISFGGTALLYFLLRKYTPSTVPFWDAFVSATAWAGMWLLAKRKIENWILLNISNIVAIPLLFYKHLAMYSALTIFLFVVAIQGYIKWRKIIQQEKIKLPAFAVMDELYEY